MSTNFSPSKISTSTRSPTFTAPSPSPSLSSATSRMNFTGGRLFFAKCPRAGWVSRDSFTNSTRPIWAASYPSFTASLCCVTTQGPACSTVTGRTSPFESNSCVMPTFLPRMPVTLIAIFVSTQLGSSLRRLLAGTVPRAPRPRKPRSLAPPDSRGRLSPHKLFMFFTECLNLHIHARGQIELHQRIYRLSRRIQNIEQPFVSADLELLPRLLIHVRRTQHAVFVLHRGQWNRTR